MWTSFGPIVTIVAMTITIDIIITIITIVAIIITIFITILIIVCILFAIVNITVVTLGIPQRGLPSWGATVPSPGPQSAAVDRRQTASQGDG